MQIDQAKHVYRLGFVLILTVAACVLFLFLIQVFVIDIFLAAIFAGLLTPLFKKAVRLFGGRKGAAAALIVAGGLLIIAFPLAGIMTAVVSEAIQLSGSVVSWVQNGLLRPESLLAALPKKLVQSREFSEALTWLSSHAADTIATLSAYLSGSVSLVLRGVGRLFLDLFVITFAMIYFLQHGPNLIARLEERIPLARPEARAIVDKTLRTTAATLRSVVVGGAVDGALVVVGFAIAGVGQPLFWGAVTVVASQTPVLGCAIVWIPAAGYLLLTGHTLAGIGLALWGTLINTVVDSLLRAFIVGRGAAIPAFVALISTLGGITAFGVSGILIGPVLAGVTIGILDLYQQALQSSGLARSD